MISCPICDEEKKVSYRCEYKYEIFEDKQYFDHLDIYKCDDCDFSFAHPMPKSKNLDFFYENVYRQVNRPPYWVTESDEDIEKRILEYKNLNYLLYLSTLIDLKKIKNIYDFGAGYGDLGYAIKKKFPNVNLFCTENDKQCAKILKKRGYKNLQIDQINEKFDLIITLHSLEHLPDLNIVSKFDQMLNSGGKIFLKFPIVLVNIFLEDHTMDLIYFFIPRKVYFQFVIDLISIRKELIFARIHLMRTIKHKEIHKIGIIELNLAYLLIV